MNTKKMISITAVVLCFCLVGIVIANTNTSGGISKGVKASQHTRVHQNKFSDYATDLHFKAWQMEDNIDVNGWSIKISDFTHSTSQRGNQPAPYHTDLKNNPRLPITHNPDNGQHAVDVTADGVHIPYCTYVTIDVDFWLTNGNVVHTDGLNWTKDANAIQAVPNFGWAIDFPTPHPTLPGIYKHRVTLSNNDTTSSINLTNIKILASVSDVNIHDTNVPFGTDSNTITVSNKILAPGQSFFVDVNTVGPYIGNHVYSTFGVNDTNAIVVTGHLVVSPPTDLPTLSQWGLIIMAGLLLTVGIVILRRFKTVSA
jgi:hypothetical protein